MILLFKDNIVFHSQTSMVYEFVTNKMYTCMLKKVKLHITVVLGKKTYQTQL